MNNIIKRTERKNGGVTIPNFIKVSICCALFFSHLSLAHEVWISPSNYQPSVGDSIDFDVRVGKDFLGDSLPHIDEWIARFEILDSQGLRKVDGELGDDLAGHSLIRKGVSEVIYRSNHSYLSLEVGKFKSYLRAEGLDEILERRKALGEENNKSREWFSRAAKTLIKSKGTTAPHRYNDFMMTLEIIPISDPYQLKAGGDFTLQVNYLKEPLTGVRVVAYNATNPAKKMRIQTNDKGQATIQLATNDEWQIKVVHMIRAPEDNKNIDWESFWASLTFNNK